MSIKTDFEAMLDAHPRWVIYVRRDIRFHCHCYDSTTEEGSWDCPDCFGTGFKVSLQKVKTREVILGRGMTLTKAEELSNPGYLLDYPLAYYFKQKVFPAALDRVAVVSWDLPNAQVPFNGRPVSLISFTQVGLVKDLAEDVESYWTSYNRSLNFDDEVVEDNLTLLRGIPVLD